MEQTNLDSRLMQCAQLWADACDATPAKLGRIVVNDTAFFTRLDSPGASTRTATLEKFVRYLVDQASWPEGLSVPADVVSLAHDVGISGTEHGASSGKADEISSGVMS